METLEAEVTGKIIELRFPFAGKVVRVNFGLGDTVRSGQELARLDTTLLSKKHVQELADYEKIRANFEQIKKKLESSSDVDEKYLMDKAQADLDSAVAAVEISQFDLDQAVMRSPVTGVVLDDGGFVVGMNISPASFSVKIVAGNSLFVIGDVSQEKLTIIKKDQYVEFKPTEYERVYKGRIHEIIPEVGKGGGKFNARVVLETTEDLLFGLKGKLTVYPER